MLDSRLVQLAAEVRTTSLGVACAIVEEGQEPVLQVSPGRRLIDRRLDVRDRVDDQRRSLDCCSPVSSSHARSGAVTPSAGGDAVRAVDAAARLDEAEESWRVVTPILDARAHGLVPMEEYVAGSTGP